MKQKVGILILLSLLIACSQQQQTPDYSLQHKHFGMALSSLEQAKKQIPYDSLLFVNEIQRLQKRYSLLADSLRQNAPDSVYALFASERFINLSYAAKTLAEAQSWFDSLFILSRNYPIYIEKNKKVSVKITQCVVNTIEGGHSHSEKEQIQLTRQAMQRQIEIVSNKPFDSIKKSDDNAYNQQVKSIVNLYASQFAGRGIISMAEPIFRAFKPWFQISANPDKTLKFSEDYMLFDKNSNSIHQTISTQKNWRFLLINPKQTPLDLVYSISCIRSIAEVNPGVPFIIARDSNTFTDLAINEVSHSLAVPFYFINLKVEDLKYYGDTTTYMAVMPNGKIAFATYNPIDFLLWIEAPLAAQKAEKELQRLKLVEAQKQRRLLAQQQAADTSLKLMKTIGNYQFILKGYWPKEVDVELKKHHFTKEEKALGNEYGFVSIVVSQSGRPIFSDGFMEETARGKSTSNTIELLSNADHTVTFRFNDKMNTNWQQAVKAIGDKLRVINNKEQFIKDYVFHGGVLQKKLKQEIAIQKQNITDYFADSVSNKKIAALLQAKVCMNNLNYSQPLKAITYNNFIQLLPTDYFDSIVYYSPYYKQIIDGWLRYGHEDLISTIDLLFGSQKWMPDQAVQSVGDYIWKQMNAMAREDVMMHIDTTFLSGCSNENVDVEKRLEGYKRMAAGNSAPDIIWEEHGETMSLSALQADTIIVIFWADWCGYCKKVLPSLYKSVSSKPSIQVVAINIDNDESSTKLGNTIMPAWHHLQAKEEWDNPYVELYNVFGTPTFVLIDKNHKIIGKYSNWESAFKVKSKK